MSLFSRFAIIISACVGGLIVLFFVGQQSLSGVAKASNELVQEDLVPIIEKDFPAMGLVQEAMSLLLNADRDAYQAYLALVEANDAKTRAALDASANDALDNVGQVLDRVRQGVEVGQIDSASMAAFTANFNKWKADVESALALSSSIFDKNQERLGLIRALGEDFPAVREIINQMQERVEAGSADMAVLNELLSADRDFYQAYIAEMKLVDATDAVEMSRIEADYRENIGQVKDRMASAATLAAGDLDELLKAFYEKFDTWSSGSDRVVGLTNEMSAQLQAYAKTGQALQELFASTRGSIDALVTILEARIPEMQKDMEAKVTDAEQKNVATQQSMRSSTMLFLILSILVAVMVVVPVVVTARKILRVMTTAINDLASASEQVNAASNELANASTHLAQGASEQAASMEETMSSLDELSSITKQNSDSANQASSGVRSSIDASDRGRQSMHKMLDTMNRIKESSEQTAQIVKSIDDIAFQTNILALNAAVEAARAGDAGRGFAVVAEEVRMLAHRSAEAAKASTVKVQDARQRTEEGVRVTQELNEILDMVNENVSGVSTMVQQVAMSSQEQTIGIDRIAGAARQVETLGQSTAANAEETASASEELASQSEVLGGIVRELNVFIHGKAESGEPSRSRVHASAPHTAHMRPTASDKRMLSLHR